MVRHLLWLAFVVGCIGACDKKEEPKSEPAGSSTGSSAGSSVAKTDPPKTDPPKTDPPKVDPPKVDPPAGSGSATTAGSAAVPVAVTGFKVGDPVMGMWTNGRWYPGKIGGANPDGTYRVNYNDGDVSKSLPANKVRARAASTGSTGNTGKTGNTTKSDAPCPGPGITRRCGGVCVNIQEDSNNCGGCGNRCPSGKHCDGHLFCRDAAGNL